MIHPTFESQDWHICVTMIGLALTNCVAAIFWKKHLPAVVIVLAIYHLLLFFGVIAAILASGTHASNSFVWQNEKSFAGWGEHGISFCVGLVSLSFVLAGKSTPSWPMGFFIYPFQAPRLACI